MKRVGQDPTAAETSAKNSAEHLAADSSHRLADALKLLPLTIGDAPAISKLLNEKSVAEQLASVELPYTLQNAQSWIKKCQAFDAELGWTTQWGIHYRGQFAGEIGFHSFKSGFKTQAALGFWVGLPFQGRGLAKESIYRVLKIGFQEYGFKLVKAAVFQGNERSRKTLQSVGFEETGFQKNFLEKQGLGLDCWLYEIRESGLKQGPP